MSTSRYGNYCRPKLQSLLEALRLDESYISAQGNYLRTAQGTDVLDLVGGFGSTILGHHHPAIKKVVTDSLSNNLAIHCQGAEQSEAACLAERLSALASTRCRYLVNFSNSGTESVEAALKHAYKKHFDHGRRTFERVSRILENVYVQLLNSELEPEIPGGRTLNKFREDLDETNIEQFEHFQNHAHVISFHGSFHGKSTSALKTTFNRTYREAFEGLSAIEPHFIDSAQPRRISEIAKEAVCRFYYPEILDGKIEIHTEQVTMVMAVMLETIRGEGGIRPLPQSTLEYLANEHSRLRLPLIVDEIQTGCGRLGSIFS